MDTKQEFGYARVSAWDQNEDRQLIAMSEYGLKKKNIYVEKKSGKDFERPIYQALLTKKKEIKIVVLDMPLLDTRQGHDLTGNLISDIVLQLLSYVAQIEWELNHQRQAEGIAAARAKDVRLGRPPKKKPRQYPYGTSGMAKPGDIRSASGQAVGGCSQDLSIVGQ